MNIMRCIATHTKRMNGMPLWNKSGVCGISYRTVKKRKSIRHTHMKQSVQMHSINIIRAVTTKRIIPYWTEPQVNDSYYTKITKNDYGYDHKLCSTNM